MYEEFCRIGLNPLQSEAVIPTGTPYVRRWAAQLRLNPLQSEAVIPTPTR